MKILLNANFPARSHIGPDLYEDVCANIGNSYISYAVMKIFGMTVDNDLIINNCVTRNEERLSEFKRMHSDSERIILILQDWVREDFPDEWYAECAKYLEILENAPSKLIVMSLGANAFTPSDMPFDYDLSERLSDAKIEFFRLLSRVAISIGVRGNYCKAILNKIGVDNVEIIGCPSYFGSGPDRRVLQPDWHENKMFGLTGVLTYSSDVNAHRYLQGDNDWPLAELIYIKDRNFIPTEWLNFLTERRRSGLIQDLAQGRIHFMLNMKEWGTHIKDNCHAVIGTRLHGAIVALNNGVPALVASGDARSRESCAYLGIPWSTLEPKIDSFEYLKDFFSSLDLKALNSIYLDRYETMRAWSEKIGLPMRHINDIGLNYLDIQKIENAIVMERLWETLASSMRKK